MSPRRNADRVQGVGPFQPSAEVERQLRDAMPWTPGVVVDGNVVARHCPMCAGLVFDGFNTEVGSTTLELHVRHHGELVKAVNIAAGSRIEDA